LLINPNHEIKIAIGKNKKISEKSLLEANSMGISK